MIQILIGIALIYFGAFRMVTVIRFTFNNKYAEEACKKKPGIVYPFLKKKFDVKTALNVKRFIGFIPALLISGMIIIIGIFLIMSF